MYKSVIMLIAPRMITIIVLSIRAADSVYYITPDGDCPTNDNCHTLSYYVDNNSFSHTINATFIFMEGQHTLGRDVIINSVYNITITAFHSQSSGSPIISCSSPVGLWFTNSTSIAITNIAINNCSDHRNISGALAFYNISGTLVLDGVTITNSNSRGAIMNRVGLVNIHKCCFDSNNNGGIELVHVQETNITRSSFIRNTAIYGNSEGGGVKVDASSDTCPILSVVHSSFTNNTALYGGGLFINIQCGNITVSNSHFSYNKVQRLGGGIRVRITSGTGYPNFTFIQSTFEHNSVLGEDILKDEPPGGVGVYLYLATIKPTTTVTVLYCIFSSNNSSYYGGGLVINQEQVNSMTELLLLHATIKHSVFQFNHAALSSAIHISFTSLNATISNCKVAYNSNENEYRHQSVVTFEERSTIVIPSYATIINCIFFNNNGIGLYGVLPSLTVTNTSFDKQEQAMNIILHYSTSLTNVSVTSSSSAGITVQCDFPLNSVLKLSGLQVCHNQDTGIVIVNCNKVQLSGINVIANNSASFDGGGIAMLGTGTLYQSKVYTTLLVSNNTAGRYGGGIYFNKWRPPGMTVNDMYEIYDIACSAYPRNNNSIKLEYNKAVVAGDNLYGGKFFHCSTTDKQTPNRSNMVEGLPNYKLKPWNEPSSLSKKPFSMISSDPIAVCLCNNYGTVDCSNTSISYSLYSGQSFSVSVAVVGLGGGVNSGNFITTTSSDIRLLSGASGNFIANRSCQTFVYTAKLLHDSFDNPLNTNVTLNISNSLIPDGYLNVSLTILPCPPGLLMDTATRSCVCNSEITHRTPGITCNVSWMPHPIQHSANTWIGYNTLLNCTIAHNGCPFDYCVPSHVKFNLSLSDVQCNHNRSGILCGQCQPGLSLMLGSNKCYRCSNDWLALVVVFAVSGILLVVILLALNLTVSVGSINGLLFYANIVKLNESSFFPQGGIPVISQLIAWINLDWGIETCFYNGLDGYWKVMLQFVFPVYLWFLVIVIIIACRCSFTVSRLCGHNAVPVLATLILMSYTKLLRTITKSLVINTIECGARKWNIWNVDGNISYLDTKHIVLSSISLLFLITGVIYTLLIFSSQWLQRYSGKCCKSTSDPVVKLKPLIDAYTGPYKDRYRFWTGLGLIVRILLTIIFTFTTGKALDVNNNFFIVLTIPLTIIGCKVYRKKCNTLIDVCSHLNLFMLASVATPLSTDGAYVSIATTISVVLEVCLILSIIVVQCLVAPKCLGKRRYNKKYDQLIHPQRNYGSFINDLPSPGYGQAQDREVLIYDDNY